MRFLGLFTVVFGVIFVLVWFYLSATKPANAAEPQAAPTALAFDTAPVEIRTQGGAVHRFTAEVARTDAQQRQGLMFRETLAADRGMLFVYEPPRRIAMWMKNTKISLDMLFAGVDGAIFQIARNTQPLSEELIATRAGVAYVLELPAGTAARLGIREGDSLVSPERNHQDH